MRSRVIVIVLLLGLSTISSSQGGSPETLDEVGSVFGGVHIEATNSGNVSSSLSELPAIIEDYTATWCTNCVTVEHALDDVEETNDAEEPVVEEAKEKKTAPVQEDDISCVAYVVNLSYGE